MTIVLVVLCGILTAATLFYIFYEEARDIGRRRDRRAVLLERKEQILENLRDLRFEYQAGKLSPTDYEQTRTLLEAELAAVLIELDALSPASSSREAPGA